MTLSQKTRNMANRTQVCNLKVWIKETLSLSKVRGVIAENIIKTSKKAIAAALNGQYNQSNIKKQYSQQNLQPWENCGCTKFCFLLSFRIFHWLWIMFLIRNFTGVLIVNFIPDWESETVNQSGLQTNLSEDWCYYAKMRTLKKRFIDGFFFKQVKIQLEKGKFTRQ